MSADCCGSSMDTIQTKRYRNAVLVALFLNVLMFVVEIAYGFNQGSVSLKADALDFFSDAAGYAITLFVLGASLRVKGYAALLKSLSMLVFGLYVLFDTYLKYMEPTLLSPHIMGWVGIGALAANLISAFVLYQFREGDSNMRSMWLCTRNDAINNVMIVIAAYVVWHTQNNWADLAAGVIIVVLALHSFKESLQRALHDIRHGTHQH